MRNGKRSTSKCGEIWKICLKNLRLEKKPHGHGISLTFYSDPPACFVVSYIQYLYTWLIGGLSIHWLLRGTPFTPLQPFYTWPFPKPCFTHSCFCLNLTRGPRKTVSCVKTRVLRENHGLHKAQFYTKTMLYTKPMIYTKTMFFAPVEALFATCRIALSGYLLLNDGWLETQPPWYIQCLSYSPIRDPKIPQK